MKNGYLLAAVALLLGMALANISLAGPITREEAQRQARIWDQLQKGLDSADDDAAKFAHIARAMKGERDVNFRRRILDAATKIPGAELERFLIDLLARDPDAGIRGQAATKLGLIGSQDC